MPERRRALLVGATGLVGSILLERLLDETLYNSVTVWARRPLALRGPGLKVETFDFEHLASHKVEADHVFCCLGTTMKQARSQQAFRRVDHDYPVALAQAAAKGGARRLLVVSALGANSASRVFYNRVKGEMEADVAAAGVPRTIFFRPSLLIGPRNEPRLGERIGQIAGRVLGPLLGKYRPIEAELVAAAMVNAAIKRLRSGVIESDQIRALAEK
ncbi:MAG: NAD(P)H-binding protein [Burkholderiales bacterium]